MKMHSLVSIIIPCYNSCQFIAKTIESVFAQTYRNWEMIIVDDCSTDNSCEIIESYAKQDARIRLFKTEHVSGSPAEPRNIGIKYADGQFIAFLDSDDLWLPAKLENQIPCFENEDTAIVYSWYEKMTQDGSRNNRIITSPNSMTYNHLLKGNSIGCLTAVYDTAKVGKHYFQPIEHEDYIYWLSILRSGYIARSTNTVEALYRVRDNSLSKNKLTASKWTWNIYRKFLKLTFIQSIYYYCFYFFKAVWKYFK